MLVVWTAAFDSLASVFSCVTGDFVPSACTKATGDLVESACSKVAGGWVASNWLETSLGLVIYT